MALKTDSPAACYILNQDYAPVPVDPECWQRWLQESGLRRFVAVSQIGFTRISTVFLGLDFSFHNLPLLFQTLVTDEAEEPVYSLSAFDSLRYGRQDDLVRLYPTWEAAICGHDEIVKSISYITGISVRHLLISSPVNA